MNSFPGRFQPVRRVFYLLIHKQLTQCFSHRAREFPRGSFCRAEGSSGLLLFGCKQKGGIQPLFLRLLDGREPNRRVDSINSLRPVSLRVPSIERAPNIGTCSLLLGFRFAAALPFCAFTVHSFVRVLFACPWNAVEAGRTQQPPPRARCFKVYEHVCVCVCRGK